MRHRTLSREMLTGRGDLYDRNECFGPSVDYVIHVHWRDEMTAPGGPSRLLAWPATSPWPQQATGHWSFARRGSSLGR